MFKNNEKELPTKSNDYAARHLTIGYQEGAKQAIVHKDLSLDLKHNVVLGVGR